MPGQETQSAQLIDVVEQIAELLETYDRHGQRAAWLRFQVAILGAPDLTSHATEHVQDELRRSVHGMGGLLDLSLGAGRTAMRKRRELDVLIEDMYALVRR